MNCKNCGFQLQEGDMFCKNCGAKVENLGGQSAVETQPVQPSVVPNTQEPVQPTTMPNMSEPVQPIPMASSYVPPQPSMMQQQNNFMGAPMQPGFNNPSAKSKSKSMFIIIGLAVVVVVLLAVLILRPSDDTTIGGSGGKVVSNQTYTVRFKNFSFKLPTDLIYEKNTDDLVICDEKETWCAYIDILNAPFSNIQTYKSNLISNLTKSGFQPANYKETTYGGINFATIEIKSKIGNGIMGFTKANAMYTFYMEVYSVSGKYDYSLFTTLAKIFKIVEYSDTSNSMAVNDKIDISVIEQALTDNTQGQIEVPEQDAQSIVPVE